MNKTHQLNVFFFKGQWLYKLNCPFNSLPYYPLSSHDIANTLKISQRTALRVCKGERDLSHAELLLLQFRVFGYVDDAIFSRAGFYIRNGSLFCHRVPDYELGSGEILEFSLLRQYYVNMASELAMTKKRLFELENPLPPEPTNIIKFSDYFKK